MLRRLDPIVGDSSIEDLCRWPRDERWQSGLEVFHSTRLRRPWTNRNVSDELLQFHNGDATTRARSPVSNEDYRVPRGVAGSPRRNRIVADEIANGVITKTDRLGQGVGKPDI